MRQNAARTIFSSNWFASKPRDTERLYREVVGGVCPAPHPGGNTEALSSRQGRRTVKSGKQVMMERTALLVRCSTDEAASIRTEAEKQRRTISGYGLRI